MTAAEFLKRVAQSPLGQKLFSLEQFPNQDPTAVPVGRHTPIFEPQSRKLWWFRHDAPCRKDEDGRNKIVQGVIVGVRKRGSPDASKDWKAAFGMSRNEFARRVEAKANCRTVGAGKWQVQIATDPNQGKELEIVDRILKFLEQLTDTLEDPEAILDEKEEARIHEAKIPETEKEQLVKARRGQGIFRDRVEGIETACRLTEVKDKRFLIASHIKPWHASDNVEKLDGSNGLLLSPHVDKLFDKGWISFSDDGKVLCGNKDIRRLMIQWRLNPDKNVGVFNPGQRKYLAYHREYVYKV